MSTRPYAVITGASSGIGLEYAKIFARLGYNLCLIARRENRLRELADKMEGYYGIDCKVISADLSTSKGVEEVCKKVRHLKVEFFLNNAGFGDCGAFSETSNSKEQSMINTNVKAVQALMKFMIKYYKHHKIDGYILNTASSAGLLAAGPYMATYYATKAYVTSLTVAVAEELRQEGSGIYVGCLCPGPVNTEFNDVANVEFALKGISARDCARTAVRGMFLRKTIIVPEKYLRFVLAGAKVLPRTFASRLTAHQQKKKLGK